MAAPQTVPQHFSHPGRGQGFNLRPLVFLDSQGVAVFMNHCAWVVLGPLFAIEFFFHRPQPICRIAFVRARLRRGVIVCTGLW